MAHRCSSLWPTRQSYTPTINDYGQCSLSFKNQLLDFILTRISIKIMNITTSTFSDMFENSIIISPDKDLEQIVQAVLLTINGI